MIELAGLTYRYPAAVQPALDGVSFEVARGELLLVAGPSGSGKSTLLRSFNGLVPHFYGGRIGGRIRVAGLDPIAAGPAALSAVVGFAFQNPESQFVTRIVEDELAFALENRGTEAPAMRRRIDEVVERLSLGELRHRAVDTLSGGERQRVAIASVLTVAPRLLVLDEPTSQLDPQGAAELLELVRQLHRTDSVTVVLAEHRLERCAHAVDRLLYLPGAGAPPRLGAPRQLLADVPGTPPVVRLAAAFGWSPPPLTVEEARPMADRVRRGPPHGRAPAAASPTGWAARISGLRHRYDGGHEALRGVDLEVAQGEVLAVMGRNGSGKSTLLKCLVGLLTPQEGRIEVLGKVLAGRGLARLSRRVAQEPQDPSRLLFEESVAAEVAYTRRAHGLPPTDPLPLLQRLGLAGVAGAYPRDLSTGERQRVALAAMLAAEPPLLLLDEPTRGLDEAAKEALVAILAALTREGGTVLLATHDAELVARCADRLALLEGGRVVDVGTTGEVMVRHPVFGSQVARLFRDPRLLTPDDVLELPGGPLA